MKFNRIPAETLSHLTYVAMSIRYSKIYPKTIVKFLSEDTKVSERAIISFPNGTKVRKNVWYILIWVYSVLLIIITIVFPCYFTVQPSIRFVVVGKKMLRNPALGEINFVA